MKPFPFPPDKVGRAREFSAIGDYDPGTSRIPLKILQEIRGKLEHWSIRNQSLATESPNVDRLLRTKSGVLPPRGPLREIKQIYIDFRDSLEYIRVQMSTGDYCIQSYVGAFSRVLTLDEILPPPSLRAK